MELTSLLFGLIFILCAAAGLIVPVVMVVWQLRANGKMPWQRRLSAQGEAARAVVLEAKRTGVSFNHRRSYLLKLLLEVRPAGRESFHTEVRKAVPGYAIAQYGQGAVLDVRFDPGNLKRVVVSGVAAPGGVAPFVGRAVFDDVMRAAVRPDGAAVRLRELKEMADAGLITRQEYESKRAEILAQM